ncbi:Zinc finger protein, partial [Trichinella patagoniensis]
LVQYRILLQDQILITMETNPFCESCNRHFSTFHQFEMHMNIHRGIKPYVCEICGNGFSSHSSMHNHMRRHSNASPIACPLCENAFAWKLSLKKHLISHAKRRHIEASRVDEIYLQQRTQHKEKKKAEKRHQRRIIDLLVLEESLPEDSEDLQMKITIHYCSISCRLFFMPQGDSAHV